jgi:hypothetical protein
MSARATAPTLGSVDDNLNVGTASVTPKSGALGRSRSFTHRDFHQNKQTASPVSCKRQHSGEPHRLHEPNRAQNTTSRKLKRSSSCSPKPANLDRRRAISFQRSMNTSVVSSNAVMSGIHTSPDWRSHSMTSTTQLLQPEANTARKSTIGRLLKTLVTGKRQSKVPDSQHDDSAAGTQADKPKLSSNSLPKADFFKSRTVS